MSKINITFDWIDGFSKFKNSQKAGKVYYMSEKRIGVIRTKKRTHYAKSVKVGGRSGIVCLKKILLCTVKIVLIHFLVFLF